MATKKRSTTAHGKSTSTRKTSTRTRKRATTVSEPAIELEAREEEPAAAPIEESTTVVTIVPEPGFAARFAPAPPPRPRPEQRRGIFFDVENTSRPQDIDHVLRYLMIDRVGIDTDFTAVGNWRVIGHETARLLAQNGASLVHSAPSVGVRDWSDLRIAVAAGVWLASARPGDMIDIVSDDQAFDAVGDVASSLGVQYRRLSYRSLRGQVGHEVEAAPSTSSAAANRSRRRGRGGRGRRGPDRASDRRHEAPRYQAPAPYRPQPAPAVAAAPVEDDPNAHTAPHDELIDVVRDMMGTSPGGVTLDQLANALRERGFRRTPGSPRLITRLKRIKELDVNRNGLIRLGDDVDPAPRASASAEAGDSHDIEPMEADGGSHVGNGLDDDGDGDGDDDNGGDAAPSEAAGEGGQRRRRRRRGGRRRRGRRGGSGGAEASAESNGEVVAAAPPAFPEY